MKPCCQVATSATHDIPQSHTAGIGIRCRVDLNAPEPACVHLNTCNVPASRNICSLGFFGGGAFFPGCSFLGRLFPCRPGLLGLYRHLGFARPISGRFVIPAIAGNRFCVTCRRFFNRLCFRFFRHSFICDRRIGLLPGHRLQLFRRSTNYRGPRRRHRLLFRRSCRICSWFRCWRWLLFRR